MPKRRGDSGNVAGPTKRHLLRQRSGLEVPVPFRHTPLPDPAHEIRLLRIHAGSDGESIIGDLTVHRLSNAPPYLAVSYTWGPAHPQEEITVNKGTLYVRQACHYALWQARSHTRGSVLLWVDSICINQTDNDEKAYQVGMISEIFRQSKKTIACIGPHADDSRFVFETLNRKVGAMPAVDGFHEDCDSCIAMLDEEGEFATLSEEEDPVHSLHKWAASLPPSDLERLDASLHFLSERSYWERMWIYPEVAMSENMDVLCGDDIASVQTLRWLVSIFHWILLDTPNKDALSKALKSYCKRYHSPGPLWQVIVTHFEQEIGPLGGWLDYLYNGLKCAFPHDTIYASVEMLTWDPHFIKPAVDYKKSTIKLMTEVVPHISMVGIGFPGNIRMLLDLISSDVQRDRNDLKALWDTRNAMHRRLRTPLSQGTSGMCACREAKPSCTALWRCSLWHDEETCSAVLRTWRNGSLGLFVNDSSQSRLHERQRELLASRPPGSISLLGVDIGVRSQEIVGYVDACAKAGDFIVQSTGHMSPGQHTVLRRAYGDVFEIVGHAMIHPFVSLQAGIENLGEKASAANDDCSPLGLPALFFDFWLDAEDVLAYTFEGAERQSQRSLERTAKLIGCNFTSHRFSSFVTVCSGQEPSNADSTCPQCAADVQRCVCINCGGSLDEVNAELPLSFDR